MVPSDAAGVSQLSPSVTENDTGVPSDVDTSKLKSSDPPTSSEEVADKGDTTSEGTAGSVTSTVATATADW